MRSNLSGECIAPLIHVDNLESQYDMVNGCGVQCEDPKITKDEHEQIHGMIAWGASISFACNLFAVVSSFSLIKIFQQNIYNLRINFFLAIVFNRMEIRQQIPSTYNFLHQSMLHDLKFRLVSSIFTKYKG